ncbi:MAG TPA: hypothetical protein VHX59_17920 [Mycobacteriales bacterium]|jgi:hypothetical protein|nr:hypothetical protein [Mycobacteriales bacterium]
MQTARLYGRVVRLALGLVDRVRPADNDRGDVPGWVMVTLMSAILVVAILVPFRSQVLPAIQSAINSVIDVGKN